MNPSLIFLALGLFTWGIGEGMFFIFQPIYLQQLGADPLTIGYILGGFGTAMAITHIPAGHLSDRLGRKPMLVTAWLIGLLATIIMALATSLWPYVAGLLIYGLTAFVTSPLDSYVTAARGNWSVGRAITLISTTFNLGMALGPVTGGWIGEHFGLRTVFFVAAGIFVISTLFLVQIAPQPRDHHDEENPPLSILRNARFLNFMLLGFFIITATFLPQPLTPNFLQNQRGLSLSVIGQIGSIGNFGNAVMTFALGHLEARLGFILGQVCVALFSFIMWRASGFGWYAFAYFLLGGYRAERALFAAEVRPLVHQSQMGLAFGVAEFVASAAIILSPIIAGYIYDYNPVIIYPIALGAILICIMASIIFAPKST